MVGIIRGIEYGCNRTTWPRIECLSGEVIDPPYLEGFLGFRDGEEEQREGCKTFPKRRIVDGE